MARRKAARKSGKQATSKSVQAAIFPADRLPSELIHMVFKYLKPTEAAAFRWAGRVVAQIGLHYLAPTVYLTLNEKSYDRLLAIAEHPVVSKSVKCLRYEADTLKVRTREDWEPYLLGPAYLQAHQDLPEVPKHDASDRDFRAFHREISIMKTMPHHTYTKSQIDRAFSNYQTFCADQDHLRHHKFFPQKIATAFKNMCNIKRVFLSAHDASHRYATEIKKVLGGWYSPSVHLPGERSAKVANVSLMRSIFHGAVLAEIQLEALCCEATNWRIFEHDNKDFAALKSTARSLKSLDLQLHTPNSVTVPRNLAERLEITSYREFLQKGKLLEFLMSAPDLTSLGITLGHCDPFGGTSLKDIVGDFNWSSLQVVSFFHIAFEEEQLLGFCRRHSATLKDFSMGSLFMKEGSWYSMFHKMRQILKLEDAIISGTYGGGDMGIWQMDPDDYEDEDDLYSSPSVVIREYLLSHDEEDMSLEEFLEDLGLA